MTTSKVPPVEPSNKDKVVDQPVSNVDETPTTDTRVAELESRVTELEKTVKRLEKAVKRSEKSVKDVKNRNEDLCDYLYGTNVRPPLTQREDDAYPADVKSSNEDD